MQLTTLSNLKSPPRTAMEVFNILPEGTIAEVINNVLYINPSQNVTHQSVLGDILTALLLYIKDKNLGTCVTWVDVYLDENNAVQPDIYLSQQKIFLS